MSEVNSLQFDFDWIDVPGRAEPVVAATLARLTIRVGETIATQVFDKRARTIRDWIVTPLAPLAEWIAVHWWSLLEETPRQKSPISAAWPDDSDSILTTWMT